MALRADDVDLTRDSLLVERFQEGDAQAFDDLYRRYFARLQRYCLKRVGDPHEAEELAQEAFVRALRAMPHFDGERRFYPWMTVIAGRLCIDAHRRRHRTEPTADIDLGAVEDEAAVADDADARHLAGALAQLAPRHREVLELRAVREWSYQQIADHLAVNVGTVESLLHRARKALRRELVAVTGDPRGRLAGVPLVGALARRLHDLRLRVGTRMAQVAEAASPLTVKAASVVVAVGVGGMAGAPGPTLAPAAAPPAVLELARSDAPLATDEASAGAPITPAPVAAPAPPLPPAAAPAGDAAAPPPVEASLGGGAARVTGSRTAADEAERTEMHGELPVGTEYGVSPSGPAAKAVGLIEDVQGRLS